MVVVHGRKTALLPSRVVSNYFWNQSFQTNLFCLQLTQVTAPWDLQSTTLNRQTSVEKCRCCGLPIFLIHPRESCRHNAWRSKPLKVVTCEKFGHSGGFLYLCAFVHLGNFFPKLNASTEYPNDKWPVSNPGMAGFDEWHSTEVCMSARARVRLSTRACVCVGVGGRGLWERDVSVVQEFHRVKNNFKWFDDEAAAEILMHTLRASHRP